MYKQWTILHCFIDAGYSLYIKLALSVAFTADHVHCLTINKDSTTKGFDYISYFRGGGFNTHTVYVVPRRTQVIFKDVLLILLYIKRPKSISIPLYR